MDAQAVSTGNFVMFAAKKKKKGRWSNFGGNYGTKKIHTRIQIYIKMGENTPCFCVKVNYLGETIDKEIGEQFQEQSLGKSKRDHGAKWRGQKHHTQVTGEKAESGQRGR